jgi:hypothetical protein
MKRIIETTTNVANQTLINVDIQPEYKSVFSFSLAKWIDFLNQNYDHVNNMVFLYNGHDTLGMITEMDYKMWLAENGVSDEVLDGSMFYDKGYAFFRYCMDNSIDDDDIVDFVKFMIRNNITDSREMTKELWKQYAKEQHHPWTREELIALLNGADDMVNIPDLMDFLKRYNGIVLTGGGINECLKEVEISLKALGKNYTVFTEFTY